MKNKNPLRAFLIILLVLIIGYGLSWAVVVGAIKFITHCFGWRYSLAHSTGLWGILMLIWILAHPGKRRGKK